jgi:hypothetical protein
MKVEKTIRGFEIIKFKDINNVECSLQQSSAAIYEIPGTGAIWFGASDRMHLSRKQLKKILPHLQAWVDSGSFKIKKHKL